MKVSFAFFSHPGKIRTGNQDGLLVGDILLLNGKMDAPVCDTHELENKAGLYVVVDGAGGHAAGEVACKTILTELKKRSEESCFKPDDAGVTERELLIHLNLIQDRMTEMANNDSELSGMAATLAGILISPNLLMAFNCGDSRVYRFKGGFLSKLTHDHSVVQQLCDQGMIREEEMRIHPQKNQITAALQALGSPVELFVSTKELKGGERFLICCDGVWEALSTEQMEACLDEDSLENRARKLFDALMSTECRDNVSFILIDTSAAG